MGYTPYKMLGHELPGPNQRTPNKLSLEVDPLNDEMVDKTSKKSGTLYTKGGVGSSPAKGFWDSVKSIGKKMLDPLGIKKKAKKVFGLGGDDAPVEGGGDGGAVAPHGDEAHTGGAIGNEEGGSWEAMGQEEFSSMDAKDRMGYMKGLSKDQRKQQMMSNRAAHSANWGGGGIAQNVNKQGNITGVSTQPGGFGWQPGAGVSSIFSDARLKEKIEKTGDSPSGIPTYEFNYIGDNSRYSGVMAQDLLEMNIDAVSMDDSGFYTVNYNNIDVDMHLIN